MNEIVKLSEDSVVAKLAQMETEILQGRFRSEMWMSVEVKWIRCAKRDGGNVQRGKAWGRIVYFDWITGMAITRDRAIILALESESIRRGKQRLLFKVQCAMCDREGDGRNNGWGKLRYLEHTMHICPNCQQEIYEESSKPWQKN